MEHQWDLDPAPFFANLFPAHKEADWVKAQLKFRKIIVRKINNSFQFIDDLQSLNDDSTFEKQYMDIYSAELELKKENDSNSCGFVFIFTFTLKMKNFMVNYLTDEITLSPT